MKSKIILIGIIIILITTLSMSYIQHSINQDLDMYSINTVELQSRLDNIDGIGEKLKVRVAIVVDSMQDEVNEINKAKINNLKIASVILMCVTFLIDIIIMFIVGLVIMSTKSDSNIKEHRASQKLLCKIFNFISDVKEDV